MGYTTSGTMDGSENEKSKSQKRQKAFLFFLLTSKSQEMTVIYKPAERHRSQKSQCGWSAS